MQLELNIAKNKCMRVIDESTICQEETGEIVIPDAQPDVVRIADVFSNAMLKSKEAEQGRGVIKGILQTTVIYASKDEGMYRAEIPVPFTVTVNKAEITSDCAISTLVNVISADAVVSNARKIIVRLNIKADVTSFAAAELDICSGINHESVFQKRELLDVLCMSQYSEKTFVITDDIVLDDKKACEFDILSCEYSFRDISFGISGGKVIIRGKLETRICWIAEDSIIPTVCMWTTEFSQMLDCDAADLTENVIVKLMMTGCYCDSDMYSQGGDAASVSIEIHAVAQCEIFEKREIEILSDLYTVLGKTEYEWEEIALAPCPRDEFKTVQIREKACSAELFDNIVSVRVTFGEVHRENKYYKVNGYVSVCGYNKNAEVTAVKTGFQVTCDNDMESSHVSVCAENIVTEVSGENLLVCCDVKFTICDKSAPVIKNLKTAELDTDSKSEYTHSVILCRVNEGDTLWSLGKKYLSSCDLIRHVNGMEEEDVLTVGKMILIPKI